MTHPTRHVFPFTLNLAHKAALVDKQPVKMAVSVAIPSLNPSRWQTKDQAPPVVVCTGAALCHYCPRASLSVLLPEESPRALRPGSTTGLSSWNRVAMAQALSCRRPDWLLMVFTALELSDGGLSQLPTSLPLLTSVQCVYVCMCMCVLICLCLCVYVCTYLCVIVCFCLVHSTLHIALCGHTSIQGLRPECGRNSGSAVVVQTATAFHLEGIYGA